MNMNQEACSRKLGVHSGPSTDLSTQGAIEVVHPMTILSTLHRLYSPRVAYQQSNTGKCTCT
jgi:hypothetical protein